MRKALEVGDSLPVCGISAEDFAMCVDYSVRGDNLQDDIRRARLLGFGNDVKVMPGAVVRIGDNEIGENSLIGLFCYVNGDVRIGRNVLIGPHCSLPASNHKFDAKTQCFSGRDAPGPIIIGDGSWLASGCTVTGGVTIGKCNLICANSVVTKDTPDYAIMAGTPARPIGRIDPESGEYLWFHQQ
ncbi:MAG: acyltransferase [Victivallaceae bacterium]